MTDDTNRSSVLPGDQLGRYRLESKLGEGGMGVVYRASDTEDGRTVALKVVRPELSGDPEWRKRFAHEAKAAARFAHPNIVTVYEIGSEGGLDYISMEYLEGETLDQKMGRRPLGRSEALCHAAAIADAISAAHSAGIVHRDLKPANVFITGEGDLKVLDFGLAKFMEDGPGDVNATRTMSTQLGQILGTVSYMSPEQAEGRAVDARSDIFSFGAVLYEMITCRRAFTGESNIATMAAILRDQPQPAREAAPSISTDLDELIAKCLQKTPAKRFASMSEVRAALEALVRSEQARRLPRSAGRWTAWAGGAGLVIAGYFGMDWLSGHAKIADIYLVCFLVGFAFSVVAVLSGSLHLPHVHIGDIHDVPVGQSVPGTGALPHVNAGSIAAFLVWFGGAGYILSGRFGLNLPVSYAAAVVSGGAGAAVVMAFLTRVLMAHDEPLNPADYDMVGVKGRLSSSIREGGTGEMIFSQAGARKAIAARSANGAPIARDRQVIVLRYEKGIAFVRDASER